ncbi:MAG: hypothetical protein ACXAC7_17295 [Candidatus Hodarchaeales archaeon]|jgi:hypothetical protein
MNRTNWFKSLGFTIPREHGLTVIWASSVILGLCSALLKNISPVGLFIVLLLSLTVLISNESIQLTFKTQFQKTKWIPWVAIFLITISLIYVKNDLSLLVSLFFLVIFFLVWTLHLFTIKNVDYSSTELSG